MNNLQKILAITGLTIVFGTTVQAAGVNSANMTTFSSDTTAVASEVNANFAEQTTQINDNDVRVTGNATAIGTKQNRVTGTCPAGQSIRAINANGTTVTCEVDTVGTGDITGVTAGTGLTGGGTSGTVTLNLAPVNEILAIPAEAFVDQGGGPVTTSSGNGGAWRLTAGSGAMVAPLYFPDGANITNITVFVEDNAAGDFSINLGRRTFTANGFVFLDTVTTTGASTAIQTLDGGALTVTVNNSTSNYFIRAFSAAWPGNSTLRINGARVTYTK